MPDAEKEQKLETQNDTWFWVFVVIILVFVGGVIDIITVAISEMNENLPQNIDAVIYDQGRNRYKEQIRAVQKYMGFIKTIHVISTSHLENYEGNGKIPVTYIVDESASTQEQAFEKIPSLSTLPNGGISEHAIFLSDRTFPCYKIYKTYLFYGEHPRMFNVMQNQAEVNFFQAPQVPSVGAVDSNVPNYWEPTIVTMVGNIRYMAKYNNVREYLFDEITRAQVVLRNDMNRDVFVNYDNPDASDDQLKHLEEQKPLFATFHVSGSDLDGANNKLIGWLANTKLFQ